MRFKLFITTLFIFVAISKSLPSNYYISNKGNDKNPGTSPNNPWKSITKVNSTRFAPGDSILFKKGNTWRMETLNLNSSGTKNKFITVSAYGKGNKPKFYGSKEIRTFTLKNSYSNIYIGNDDIYINPTNYNNKSYKGSIFYIKKDTIIWGDGITDYKSSIDELQNNYEWTWQNNKIILFYNGDINDISSIECTQTDRGINIQGEYITIEGIDIRYFGSRCIGSTVYPETKLNGVYIRNCHLAYTASRSEGVGFGIALFHSNMTIENNVIHNNGRRNISLNIVATTGSCTMRDVIIQNNQLYDGWHTVGIDIGIQGRNHTVRNIIIRGNKIWEYYGVKKDKHAVAMNFIENNGDPGDIDSIFFYNNVVMNCRGPGLMINGINNVFISNNTFSGNLYKGPGASGFIYHGGNMTGNSTIINNIFYNYTKRSDNLYISVRYANGGATSVDALDYNLYHTIDDENYIVTNLNGAYYKLSQLRNLKEKNYETHSVIIKSLNTYFEDSLIDLHVKSNSPAIGKGKPVPFIKTDIEGHLRDIKTPDIGAFEYQSDFKK